MRIKKAVAVIKAGGVIAYPTEGVFGLGCDPFNPAAVHRLLQIKQRPVSKGLILIASEWEYFKELVENIPSARMAAVRASWPGPYTWIFPASQIVPPWIKGDYETVALRVTAHPIASALSKAFEGPLVSTSANIANEPPLIQVEQVRAQFMDKVDFILPGRTGALAGPTAIKDAVTGQLLRGS